MRTLNIFVIAATVVVSASSAEAGHFCHHCGCERNCKKVCRLEKKTKKETKVEYGIECEDFCIPGHSKKCGTKIECDANGHRHHVVIWQPTCAKVHTRKKLVKKEVTKEVPDYKWVVEEYCCICGQCVKMESKPKAGDRAQNQLEDDSLIADDGRDGAWPGEAPAGDEAEFVQAVAEEAVPVDDVASREDNGPQRQELRRPLTGIVIRPLRPRQ